MAIFNPYAVYVRCDGSMDYDSKNTGGAGFVIEFPENNSEESVTGIVGRYEGANIERLELNAILKGMSKILDIYKENPEKFKNINTVIVVTDRYSLNDDCKTNPYKLRDYRKRGWANHENKPIKNADLLDKIDKARKNISDKIKSSVKIEYQPRKYNKIADKLAAAGKKKIFVDRSIARSGIKLCKRKFDGGEVDYSFFKEKMNINVRIFKKELLKEKWEMHAEIIDGKYLGEKMKIYIDKKLEKRIHLHGIYELKIKKVYRYHIEIFRTIKKYEK